MNIYESIFVDKYIAKSKKDRLKFELTTSKNRERFMLRFCHDAEKYIVSNKIVFHGKTKDVFTKKMIEANEGIYVLSLKYINGLFMNIYELQQYLNTEYMSVIVITNSFVLIKEENENESNSYLLNDNG